METTSKDDEISLLKEILKWIKFAGMKEVKNILIDILDTDEKKISYQKSDGSRGLSEVAKLAGLGSKKPVEIMWDDWLKASLGENIPVRGGNRFKRSFDLEDFGIKVPEPKAAELKVETEEKSAEQKPEPAK